MSWVAVAVVGGAVIGGVATTISGNKAAGAEEQASANATQEEQREFDINQSNLAPYRAAGLGPLSQLSAGLAPGGQFNKTYNASTILQDDPGYQFRMDQGQQALQRSAAAGAGILNGGTLKALARYGQDYASNEYSNAYNRFNNDQTTRFNRLSSLAGTSQTATNQTAALGTQVASEIGSNTLQGGNAAAAGFINSGNAINSGVSSLGNFYLQQQYLNRLGGGSSGGGVPLTYSPTNSLSDWNDAQELP